jgi:hypothetical protein
VDIYGSCGERQAPNGLDQRELEPATAANEAVSNRATIRKLPFATGYDHDFVRLANNDVRLDEYDEQ